MRARLFTDGGARGNPGPAAYGYVLEAEDGTVLASHGEAIGVATNNVAEYSGLIAGLRRAVELQVPELEVVSDSELMVKQMRGEYKVKNEALRGLSLEAARIARQLGSVEYRHVKRAHNELADRLVNDALDAGVGSTEPVSVGLGFAGPGAGKSMTVREAIEAHDVGALAALLAEDVEFRSPAVYKPYRGRDTVLALLGVVAQVFENFRYRAEWNDGATTILFFEANVGDRELQGVDILEHGDDGLVDRFTVMIRPLSGLQAVVAAIESRLG